MFNSAVFSLVANFLIGFWGDPVGRIFITTFLAYAASYMIYSSYITWFAGGYGGLLFSQMGFTAIDFLSLFPAVFFLLIEWFRNFMKKVLQFALVYLIIPIVVFAILTFIRTTLLPYKVVYNYNLSITFSAAGILMYFIGLSKAIDSSMFDEKKLRGLWVILTCTGGLLFALALPYVTPSSSSSPNSQVAMSFLNQAGIEIFATLVLIFIALSPSLIGIGLASFAVKNDLLSKLTRIVLSESIEIAGMNKKLYRQSRKLRLPSSLVYLNAKNSDRPVYLITSFTRVTALYLPTETNGKERGEMLLLANSVIVSMTLEGRKQEAKVLVSKNK